MNMIEISAFRCEANGNTMCYNGGVCTKVLSPTDNSTVLREYCACPSGFIDDNTLAHLPNCMLPDYTLSIMAGIITAFVSLAIGVVYMVYLEVRKSVKLAIQKVLLIVIFTWIVVVVRWIEEGMFQATTFFIFFHNLVIYRCLMDLVLIFALPVYSMLKRSMDRIKRVMQVLEVLHLIIQLGLHITMFVFCRDVEPSRYNFTMALTLIVFGVFTVGLAFALFVHSTKLKASVNHLSPNLQEEMKIITFQKRLRKLQIMNLFMVYFATHLFIIPVCIFVLGSFPGQFIFLFLLHIGVVLFAVFGSLLMRVEDSSNNNSRLSMKGSRANSRASKGGVDTRQNNNNPATMVRASQIGTRVVDVKPEDVFNQPQSSVVFSVTEDKKNLVDDHDGEEKQE